MKLLRTRVRELEAKLAELTEQRAADLADVRAVNERLRVTGLAATTRMNGFEDRLVDLRQHLARWTGQ